jgi:hypothetical protein
MYQTMNQHLIKLSVKEAAELHKDQGAVFALAPSKCPPIDEDLIRLGTLVDQWVRERISRASWRTPMTTFLTRLSEHGFTFYGLECALGDGWVPLRHCMLIGRQSLNLQPYKTK